MDFTGHHSLQAVFQIPDLGTRLQQSCEIGVEFPISRLKGKAKTYKNAIRREGLRGAVMVPRHAFSVRDTCSNYAYQYDRQQALTGKEKPSGNYRSKHNITNYFSTRPPAYTQPNRSSSPSYRRCIAQIMPIQHDGTEARKTTEKKQCTIRDFSTHASSRRAIKLPIFPCDAAYMQHVVQIKPERNHIAKQKEKKSSEFTAVIENNKVKRSNPKPRRSALGQKQREKLTKGVDFLAGNRR
jgi:hypothetical protein